MRWLILILFCPVVILADSFTISGSAALVDAARVYKQSPLRNYGAHVALTIGDNFIPGLRRNQILIRFNTLDDSMRAVGAATWDSARIGLTLDLMDDADDSLCVTAHKITTAGWLEGIATGTNACGSSWDSANAISYGGCAGDALDWTVDGGDYSATRETYGSHPDSVWLTPSDWSLDDTVYFYISSATLSDTMGNHAGILLHDQQYITNSGNDNYYQFDSDDQTSRRPLLQVWYTTGEPPEGNPQVIIIGMISEPQPMFEY